MTPPAVGLGRLLVTAILSVTSSLAVTTCDIQTNPAVVRNESDNEDLRLQFMVNPDRASSERSFGGSVAFPGTRSGGCVDNSWGWRIVDEDGTVLVERTFEQDPVCSGDTLVYDGNDIVRKTD